MIWFVVAWGSGWLTAYLWMRAERDKWRTMAHDLLQQKIDSTTR